MAIVSMLYGAGGASSAEEVSYDNTTSGLEADNVQDAVDEVSVRNSYSSTPTVSGTFNNKPLYRKYVSGAATISVEAGNYDLKLVMGTNIKVLSYCGFVTFTGSNFGRQTMNVHNVMYYSGAVQMGSFMVRDSSTGTDTSTLYLRIYNYGTITDASFEVGIEYVEAD